MSNSFLSLNLPKQRILSIDAFRGITILTMIFVNEVAGISGIPQWMKHMPANADAMTFVDVVFPAFLFIVGMSIPFAIQQRIKKGDSFWKLQGHILSRTIGLLVLGVFMVNGESDYNEEAMGISIHIWSLCFYVAVILVWNVYSFENKNWTYLLRFTGIIGLIALATIYRSGDGSEYMQPRWWGILGLIGWAYLYACIFFQLLRANKLGLLIMVLICTGIYILGQQEFSRNTFLIWTTNQAGNAVHTSIVLCGTILSLIFFNHNDSTTRNKKFAEAALFTLGLVVAGYLLRPYFHISKIFATPTWAFYSVVLCCIIFTLLYILIDLKQIRNWTRFFQPAASNPLLVYITPPILFNIFQEFNFYPVPKNLLYGLPGVLWCFIYAVIIMWSARGLNKLKIRLQL
ncbi:MAG TPA: DUF5009 domain-containing protein [Cytophagales bacterium]|nr:DUF5009 domain-containing protein [Cytophagales bacterium]